ncbi:hypothetical protein ESCO_000919 [Escovopsis weberi]|uniref:Uncharacterized protein n=1 Tax=Escovopsis weberi TaxID=150374 RepID=A0A0M8MV82_ESCWE|nr:hypothetical protein ESCO_000919 [Escovopsis weberi]
MTAAGLSPNQRLAPTDLSKSAIFPSMTSPASGALPKSPLSLSVGSRGQGVPEDFIAAQKKLKERQDAEQDQLLVDEEDDEVQRVLASEIEPTLDLDEFIAHTNVAPPAKDSIPAQVEAVYRDINSMIDTLGLNARSVKAFTKGHSEMRTQNARTKDDLEEPDDWILCEISELGEVLEKALPADLAEGRVRDLPDKLDVCQDLARDLHRLRAKQEDLNRIISTKLDPSQMDLSRSLPLSTEQATQQNELRREYTSFSKALGEAEEALTLLKTRIASISSATGRGNSNVPTVDAVIRTIAKMTSMVEKRSGDVDVLETQLRKLRLDSLSREGSPLRTPQQQLRRSILMSLDSTPSRAPSNMSSSIMSFGGASVKGATSKKKLSGFSREEKIELMDKRIKRQALLAKLKENVQRKGVKVWTMEDTE